jgi:hypothetical protein
MVHVDVLHAGAVYKGVMHTTLVALKKLHDPNAINELQREANILLYVSPAYVVSCIDSSSCHSAT